MKILDAKTCDELLSLGDTARGVTQLAWSPDGRQLAGIDSDGSIVVWDASKGYAYLQSESYVIENKLEKLTQAKVLFNEAKYEAALPLLDEVLSAGADNPRTLFIRGLAYERLSRIEQALADLKRATELAPFYHGAWNELGMVQIRMGLLSEAIQSLTAAIDASPEANEVAQANRATAYILSGQAATGIRELQSLFQEKGSDSTGLLLALA